MAARNAQKPAKPAPRRRATAGQRTSGSDPAAVNAALERERDALKEELRQARETIATLERQREQVVNRVDWVIDSLHSLLEDQD